MVAVEQPVRPQTATGVGQRSDTGRPEVVEFHGDLDIAIITKTHVREFRDALAKVPKRLPHKLAKLRLPDLLKKDLSSFEPRNAQTINKSLNPIAGIRMATSTQLMGGRTHSM